MKDKAVVIDLEQIGDIDRVEERLRSERTKKRVEAIEPVSQSTAERLKRRLRDEEGNRSKAHELAALSEKIESLREGLSPEKNNIPIRGKEVARQVRKKLIQETESVVIEVPFLVAVASHKSNVDELPQTLRKYATRLIVEKYGAVEVSAFRHLVETAEKSSIEREDRFVTFGAVGSGLRQRDQCQEHTEEGLHFYRQGIYRFFPLQDISEDASTPGVSQSAQEDQKRASGEVFGRSFINWLETSPSEVKVIREKLSAVFPGGSKCIEHAIEGAKGFDNLVTLREKAEKKSHQINATLRRINDRVEAQRSAAEELAEAFPQCEQLSCMANALEDRRREAARKGSRHEMMLRAHCPEVRSIRNVLDAAMSRDWFLADVEGIASETSGIIEEKLSDSGYERAEKTQRLEAVYDQVTIVPYYQGQDLGILAKFEFVLRPEDICGDLKLGEESYHVDLGGRKVRIETVKVRGNSEYGGIGSGENIEVMRHEVRWNLIHAFLEEKGESLDEHVDRDCFKEIPEVRREGRFPARCIFWESVKEVAKWVSKKVGPNFEPVDCEWWRYVASCGGKRDYAWGNVSECGEGCPANLSGGARRVTASPELSIGVSDLGGNLSEVCVDLEEEFPPARIIGGNYQVGATPVKEDFPYYGGGRVDVGFRLGRVY